MKVLFAIIMILGASLFAVASSPGFARGSEFQVVNLSGNLTIYCPGSNPTYKIIYCSEDHMLPTEFDYFVGPQVVGATSVHLSNPSVSGSRVKKSKYDSISGKSEKEFNLWIQTLLQRPLLKIGINTVSYVLVNDDKEALESGHFEVSVTQGEPRVCPSGSTISTWPEDCEANGYQRCEGYFSEYNYCQ